MHQFDWDDVRHFLEVAKARSLSGAAEKLGVNQSTVSRRVAALEKRLGAQLFDRAPGSGWVLSLAGEQVLGLAEHMADNAQQISTAVMRNRTELSGVIKVTCGDAGTQSTIVQTIAGFSRLYPQIELSIHISDQTLDLAAREADVAIRVTSQPPPNVVGKRICSIGMAIYGTEELAEQIKTGDRKIPVIVNSLDNMESPDWVQDLFPEYTAMHRCNTIPVKIETALQGIGVTKLPVVIGENTRGLVRIMPHKSDVELGFWVLSHVDLRSTARVRLFRDYLVEKFTAAAPMIAGEVLDWTWQESA